MTAICGFSVFITESIFSSFVSQNMLMLPSSRPSLSALWRTCEALSSPETYRTFLLEEQPATTCRSNVDFPIPGSPPTSTELALTMPPPRTLSSSDIPLSKRNSVSYGTSESAVEVYCEESLLTAFLSSIFSSVKEFQDPHSGHRPSHLELTYPHWEHKNWVVAFIVKSPYLPKDRILG